MYATAEIPKQVLYNNSNKKKLFKAIRRHSQDWGNQQSAAVLRFRYSDTHVRDNSDYSSVYRVYIQ